MELSLEGGIGGAQAGNWERREQEKGGCGLLYKGQS